ncbi:MAG: formylmethanofuran dehydrogenase subunit E family protein [Syntrophales bacterium]|nr:formylmethanofuran dehydrogenase subunit E family protein [Syntrophales bacterium]
MSTIGPYSFEQYLKMVEKFHGRVAPGMVTGGFMIDLARRNLPEGTFFDAISETTSCLPDTIQLLTPCTIGNGWLRVIDTGRFALTLFEKYGGEGVRVSLDVEKLEGWPELKAWFLKLTPKSEQDTKRLLEELQEAGSGIYRVEHVRVGPEYLGKQKKKNIRLCARCREPFRSDTEDICPFCTGERAYLSSVDEKGPAGVR